MVPRNPNNLVSCCCPVSPPRAMLAPRMAPGAEPQWGAEPGWAGRSAAPSYGRCLAECSSFSPPTTVILLILLCFEALLFLIFTSVMFGTQVHSICTDETVGGGIHSPQGGYMQARWGLGAWHP